MKEGMFTREELEILYSCIKEVEYVGGIDDDEQALLDKIASLLCMTHNELTAKLTEEFKERIK